jgi:heat shock protein HtpX
MVTLTLIQGIVNAFVMFLARVLAFAINQAIADRDRNGRGMGYFAQTMLIYVLQTVFMILGSLVIFWFSRWREFRADAGGAKLAGKQSMISALQSLAAIHNVGMDNVESERGQTLAAFKISAGDKVESHDCS